MNPQDFEALRQEVQNLRRELDEVKNQQIRVPLDESSIQVLSRALYNQKLERVTAKEVRYDTLTAL